jgi:hypothetical protein
MAFVAVGVIGIGELLLAVGDWAHHELHVGAYASAEENHRAEELAKLYPVGVALVIGSVFLVGGAVASRLAGDPSSRRSAQHDVARH